MNDEPRQKLRELIVEYGRSLCDDPRRCEALLKDYCGAHKREIFVLVSALKHRVAADLLTALAGVPQSILFARLCRRLEDELAMTADAARWAVESWVLALGLPVERGAPPQPAPPPPPVAAPVIKVPSASPATALQPLAVFRDRLRDGSPGPAMIVIPPGEFWMGSLETEVGRNSDERWHKIKIERTFLIGQLPVTFVEYDRFCAQTGWAEPNDAGWGRDRQPVINVSWYDALAYVGWLSEQTGQLYRLPTEAEWEYAARARTMTAYWWGDTVSPNSANYHGCGSRWVSKAAPVGSFEPNPWGLYDMSGNAWEWTCSRYSKDYDGTELRCAGDRDVGGRSVRGGSWFYASAWLRSATRHWYMPTFSNNALGFRLARFL